MKGKLPWIAGIVAAVLLAGYFGASLVVGSLVRTGVERFAPPITGTPVRLEVASLSPLSGSGTLSGLFVGNPKGWSGDKALYFGKIHVEVVPSSIFSSCIVINQLTIDKPEFVYETRVVASNIGDLLKNISGAAPAQAATAQPVDKEGQPLKFIVKHFSLTNGKVTVGLGPTALTLPMPPVTLDDVGTREGGISSAELALAVMRSATGSVVSATTNAAGKIGSTMGAAAGNSAKSATDSLKGLFGGNK